MDWTSRSLEPSIDVPMSELPAMTERPRAAMTTVQLKFLIFDVSFPFNSPSLVGAIPMSQADPTDAEIPGLPINSQLF